MSDSLHLHNSSCAVWLKCHTSTVITVNWPAVVEAEIAPQSASHPWLCFGPIEIDQLRQNSKSHLMQPLTLSVCSSLCCLLISTSFSWACCCSLPLSSYSNPIRHQSLYYEYIRIRCSLPSVLAALSAVCWFQHPSLGLVAAAFLYPPSHQSNSIKLCTLCTC